ncbi:hypothetical protein HYDPIDRAFT_133255 [Hydnomerulius pinastri MD-312]|uniref:Ubiquitin 3 binding protein But2 C-terminal domain-containing protein n=1 Tax=Hydnomerulius pinastri MD-312 TaxID=994086 RepID=A0A0C9WF72_9AGAM|nr:hypothetical protein HYDPIDRAFT_133255 [Hydnomerulius pinastri MD-312]
MPSMYEPIPSDVELVEPHNTVDKGSHLPKWHAYEALFSFALVILLVACTLLNFTALYGEYPPSSEESRTATHRPSTYMGLANIETSAVEGTVQNFSNFPFLLTQISPTSPKLVWPDDTTKGMTIIGTVSPDHRRFAISPNVSSVAQFRAVDFGYENCTLEFAMIAPGSDSMAESTRSQTSSLVDIWRLHTDQKLDVKTLSWDMRPPRSHRIGTVELEWGHVAILDKSFLCPWGTYQTFEISCAEGSNCDLDFWQDPKVPQLGLVLKQMSSLAT